MLISKLWCVRLNTGVSKDQNNHQRSDILKLVSKLSRFDGLCVLPINMINDKIYILLWFWLFILAIISGLHFIYR